MTVLTMGVGSYDRTDTGRRLTARAREVVRRLDCRKPVVVDVAGYGAGWYITAVDWRRRMFTVSRGGGGDPIDVAWTSVR